MLIVRPVQVSDCLTKSLGWAPVTLTLSTRSTPGPVAVNVSHLGASIVAALEPFGAFEVLEEAPEGFGTYRTFCGT